MADSELMKKLQRRQQFMDEQSEQDSTNDCSVKVASVEATTPLGTYQAPVLGIQKSPPKPSTETVSVPPQLISPTGSSKENNQAENELQMRLQRQQNLNDGVEPTSKGSIRKIGIYAEFTEFSRKQIKGLQETFKKFDSCNSGHMNLTDLKRLMESLGAPQTHIALKGMLREVDEDLDGLINQREFLLIFRKAAAGQLQLDSSALAELASLGSIDVTEEGVLGARDFFEAKIKVVTGGSAFEREVREEQDARQREADEKEMRKQKFKQNLASFQ